MQGALDGGRKQGREGLSASGVRATELAEDLTLAGDRGIETGRKAEKVGHRFGLGADDDRVQRSGCFVGTAQPGVGINVRGKTCEDLDAMTCDERKRPSLDRLRGRLGEALARVDRRVPLVERPRGESFADGVDRMREDATRKRDREVYLTSRGITEDARACQRACLTSGDTPGDPASPRQTSPEPWRRPSR